MDVARPRALRLFAEFAVIVFGVLVALALDAAWEARQDAARLDTYLVRLEADLRESARELDEAIAADSLVYASAYSFIGGITSEPMAAADSLDVWFTRTYSPSIFHPRTGTLQALIQSGDLRLVEDAELHDAILTQATSVDMWGTFYSSMHETQLRAFGRFGYFVNVETELGSERTVTPDWRTLSRQPGLISEVRQFGISAGYRMDVLLRLRASQRALLQRLEERGAR
jgi:hypothetical protein